MAGRIHQVKEGETLYSLSRKYGVPSYIIGKENEIVEVRTGMRIIIPSPEGIKYTVRPFDTLESIAALYNIPVVRLSANNRDIAKVFLGQVIYIPYSD